MELDGLEPSAFCLPDRRSSHLSYSPEVGAGWDCLSSYGELPPLLGHTVLERATAGGLQPPSFPSRPYSQPASSRAGATRRLLSDTRTPRRPGEPPAAPLPLPSMCCPLRVVETEGLEPSTFCVRHRCSRHLSYVPSVSPDVLVVELPNPCCSWGPWTSTQHLPGSPERLGTRSWWTWPDQPLYLTGCYPI